jgi:hypothetical protein
MLTTYKKDFLFMEVKYTPVPCDGVVFKGHVVIKKLNMDQKIDAMAKFRGVDNEDPEQLKLMMAWAKPFIKAVEIENVLDASKYSSFEDLHGDGETMEILIDVAMAILMGPGKKKMMKIPEASPSAAK